MKQPLSAKAEVLEVLAGDLIPIVLADGRVRKISPATFAEAINLALLIPSNGPVTGSPEGVVTALPASTRWDESTGIFWLKRTGTGNTGWFAFLTLDPSDL